MASCSIKGGEFLDLLRILSAFLDLREFSDFQLYTQGLGATLSYGYV
jgi:hypothetical protein